MKNKLLQKQTTGRGQGYWHQDTLGLTNERFLF